MIFLAAVPWMALLVLVPLSAAIVTFLFSRRAALIALISALAVLLCVAGLIWKVVELGPQRHHVGGWGAPLGIDLYADGLSSLMLAMTALVGLATNVYAAGYFLSDQRQRTFFWPLWLFLWAALNALFLAADAFNIYVTLELLGLSAVPLAALTGSAKALSAAMRYLLVSLLGSLAYLAGVALLYARYGVLDLTELSQVISPAPLAWVSMTMMTIGLLLKTALFPLHFWLPPAHANAPAPVSALLSALVVKAPFYLVLRLWFDMFPLALMPAAHQCLGVLGGAAIFWGSIVALRQQRLKLLIAYSTVAQLGYLFLTFPLAAMAGFTAWSGGVYFALSHALAKAAMFLSAGALMHMAGHDHIENLNSIILRQPLSMMAFTLAGINLIGLPPSGGFLAKWLLLKAALLSGQWWWAVVILIGSLLAACYVFRIIARVFVPTAEKRSFPAVKRSLEWSALALALAAAVLGFVATQPLALLSIGSRFATQSPLEIAP